MAADQLQILPPFCLNELILFPNRIVNKDDNRIARGPCVTHIYTCAYTKTQMLTYTTASNAVHYSLAAEKRVKSECQRKMPKFRRQTDEEEEEAGWKKPVIRQNLNYKKSSSDRKYLSGEKIVTLRLKSFETSKMLIQNEKHIHIAVTHRHVHAI